MTLSRRDSIAAAVLASYRINGSTSAELTATLSVADADALIAELDRTAPAPLRPAYPPLSGICDIAGCEVAADLCVVHHWEKVNACAHAAVVAVLRELLLRGSYIAGGVCADLDRLAGRPVGTLLREVRGDA